MLGRVAGWAVSYTPGPGGKLLAGPSGWHVLRCAGPGLGRLG